MTAAVAFGLRALMCALKARAGGITEQDLRELDEVRLAEAPDDAAAARAVGQFSLRVHVGQQRDAGLRLMDDLAEMMERAAMDATRTQAALAAAGAADWQQRKDLE